MTEVIPAIMPRNYEDLKNRIALVRGLVQTVQIDICDGRFVRTATWPFTDSDLALDFHAQAILNEEEGLPFWEEMDFEFDLMVADAVENFDFYTKFGPRRIIFHLEAQPDLEAFREFLEGIDLFLRENIQIGVAINPNTPIEKIFPMVNHIDFVQCMGIEKIGYQGEPFDERVLNQIESLRKKYADVIISVDGAVDIDTGPKLVAAGANRLIAGSAIFKSADMRETITYLENIEIYK